MWLLEWRIETGEVSRLVPAEGHLLFSAGKKVSKNPVAASAASEGSGLAWLVQPAPAECEKKAERGFSGLA